MRLSSRPSLRPWFALALLLAAAAPLPAAGQAPEPAEARRVELDRAFAALRAAPDTAGAVMVAHRIHELWAEAAGPATGLLLNRGLRQLAAHQAAAALEDFDAALALAPDHPEAWHLRAQAQIASRDPEAAARDLREALRLEPRHWGALATLSRLQDQEGDAAGALRSLEAALAINPHLPEGAARRARLRRSVEGDAL